MSNTGGTIEEYSYDNRSRLSQRKITSDAIYYYNYTYGSHGQIDTLTYPTSTSSYRLAVKHLYENGLLKQVKDDNASTVFWQASTVNPRGQVSQETLGNGVVTSRVYDAVTGWISSIQSGSGGGSALQNESYLQDMVGNIIQRQQNNLGLTESFYYDNLYRLQESRLGSTTNLTLAYDALGNITSRSDVAGGATWTYHATKKHAVTQAGSASYTYTYDANGNAETRNGHAITWNRYNYPTVINGPGKTLTFGYDGNHQRYQQIYNNGSLTETTMYVGGLLEKVTVGTLTDYRHYIRVGRQTVAVMSRQSSGTNAMRYMLEDHQGSVANILDGTGTSYVTESFTAFGARRDPADWSGDCPCPDLAKIAGVSRMGYTGHEAIGGVSMGLNHMNGRVQDAITGRFLSADPYVTQPGNTQNFNRYSYVYNNPLSFRDPSGFDGTGICSDTAVSTISRFGNPVCETVTVETSRDSMYSVHYFQDFINYQFEIDNMTPPNSEGAGAGESDATTISGNPTRYDGTTGAPRSIREREMRINKEFACAQAASNAARPLATVAAFTVTGAQRGPMGAVIGLGVGVAVAGAVEVFSDDQGVTSAINGLGAIASEGGNPAAFFGSQISSATERMLPDHPGLGYVGGGAVGNVLANAIKNGRVGAARAGMYGGAAGAAYLLTYGAVFNTSFSRCMR